MSPNRILIYKISAYIVYIMYQKRDAELLLKKILSGDKVGIILGARQVGKTTLVKHVNPISAIDAGIIRYMAITTGSRLFYW